MPISKTNGYFENPREKPMLFLLALKWHLWENAFSSIKTKTNLNFGVKLAERKNRLLSVYLINHLFQTSVLFNMSQLNLKNLLIDYVNVWRRSEAANLLFQ